MFMECLWLLFGEETEVEATVTIQARDDGGLGGESGMMIRGQILLNVVGRADRMC